MNKSTYNKIVFEKIPITVSQTLSKHTSITKDINDNDLNKCFNEEHWDIKNLLQVLKEYIKGDMIKHYSNRTNRQLSTIYTDCCDWIEDEFEIIKD